MKILIKLILPFYSHTLSKSFHDKIEVDFRGINYKLTIEDFSITENITLIHIEWFASPKKNLDQSIKNEIIETGIDFLNFIVYHARTFDMHAAHMPLVSPRTVSTVKLKLDDAMEEDIRLENQPPEYFQEYYYLINEPGATELFHEVIGEGEAGVQLVEINLIVDAYYAVYESRYSEAIINCMTAVEMHIYPWLFDWLLKSFFHKDEKKVEDLIIEMSANTKFELLFGTVAVEYLKAEGDLLKELKKINHLRNQIIHKGKRASKAESYDCLNTCSKLLLILHFRIEAEK